ncbi:unnamed protein product [Protopolystoma xenopodis]|uniref:RNA-polymerase II-associated protein 3-like C-terminal domain-containing protein n=1 Tax=Protopolystoma xenopodis TaxID=117903 RepID=A0A448WG83_9PLAT|nr:unnamed protein product [Protopolystoma xenopodis]
MTTSQFVRIWRHLAQQPDHSSRLHYNRFQLLSSQNPLLFRQIFDSGLGVSLFSELIEALYWSSDQLFSSELFKDGVASLPRKEVFLIIYNILLAIVQSKQVSIALDCLTLSESELLRKLFHVLSTSLSKDPELKSFTEIACKISLDELQTKFTKV